MGKSKTAVLIQTHNNANYILALAELNPNVIFFIHVDLKADEVFFEIKKSNLKNIVLIEPRISVFWGGVSQVYATLKLLEAATKNSEALYFHLISGECYPLLPFKEIEDEWKCSPRLNFIESRKRTDNEWRVRAWMPHANSKHMRTFLGRVLKKILRVVSIYFITSRIKDEIYYGSQWFSINRDLADKIVKVYTEGDYFKKFSRITCADEHAFQMLIQKLKSTEIADYNRRYIKFEYGASSPLYLDAKCIHEINDSVQQKYWFARKVLEVDMINLLNSSE